MHVHRASSVNLTVISILWIISTISLMIWFSSKPQALSAKIVPDAKDHTEKIPEIVEQAPPLVDASTKPSFADLVEYASSIRWVKRSDAKTFHSIQFSPPPVRLLHVINPFDTTSSKHRAIQEMTMASLDTAKMWLTHKNISSKFLVDITTVEYEGTESIGYNNTLSNSIERTNISSSTGVIPSAIFRPQSFLRSPIPLKLTSVELAQSKWRELGINKNVKPIVRPVMREILQVAEYMTLKSRKPPSSSNSLQAKSSIYAKSHSSGTHSNPNNNSTDDDSHFVETPYTHVIYTNMDINVMPNFYLAVYELLSCYQTFFINRVEIPQAIVKDFTTFGNDVASRGYASPHKQLSPRTIDVAYSYGMRFKQLHPGFDCMVVATKHLPKVNSYLGNVFTGFPPVGGILTRAAYYADLNCVTLKGMQLTFHLGSRNGDWAGDNDTKAYGELNGKLFADRFSYLKALEKKRIYEEQYSRNGSDATIATAAWLFSADIGHNNMTRYATRKLHATIRRDNYFEREHNSAKRYKDRLLHKHSQYRSNQVKDSNIGNSGNKIITRGRIVNRIRSENNAGSTRSERRAVNANRPQKPAERTISKLKCPLIQYNGKSGLSSKNGNKCFIDYPYYATTEADKRHIGKYCFYEDGKGKLIAARQRKEAVVATAAARATSNAN